MCEIKISIDELLANAKANKISRGKYFEFVVTTLWDMPLWTFQNRVVSEWEDNYRSIAEILNIFGLPEESMDELYYRDLIFLAKKCLESSEPNINEKVMRMAGPLYDITESLFNVLRRKGVKL